MRRVGVVLFALCSVLYASPADARPAWKVKVDNAVKGKSVGVAIGIDGRFLYRYDSKTRRAPASNQKLLMTMALFDELGPKARIPTKLAATTRLKNGVLSGDMWIIGRGNPALASGGSFAKTLPFEPTRVGDLVQAVRQAGVQRITGSVVGSTGYFARDWYAPGWKSDFATNEVALPTALTFQGNTVDGRHVDDPERRLAKELTHRLEDRGIRVRKRAGAGLPPPGLVRLGQVKSPNLVTMTRYMNRQSSNFFAEVFGKKLGAAHYGPPGTIAHGAMATEAWARGNGVTIVAHDSSGLSYSNSVAPGGMVRLLTRAADRPWGKVLLRELPKGGQGTLEDRLGGVRVRAKTGTLTYVSTLSGWIWLNKVDAWAEFSIMSRGMYKSTAAEMEDRILRVVTRAAH